MAQGESCCVNVKAKNILNMWPNSGVVWTVGPIQLLLSFYFLKSWHRRAKIFWPFSSRYVEKRYAKVWSLVLNETSKIQPSIQLASSRFKQRDEEDETVERSDGQTKFDRRCLLKSSMVKHNQRNLVPSPYR